MGAPTKSRGADRLWLSFTGWAWPIEATVRGGPVTDPLLRAVVELVRCGLCTPAQVSRKLAPALPGGLAAGALQEAIARGFIERRDDGRLDVVGGSDPADGELPEAEEPAVLHGGWVFWDGLRELLLPIVFLGERVPGRPDDECLIGARLSTVRPSPRAVNDGLTGLALSPRLELLEARPDGPVAIEGAGLEAIYLPRGARAVPVTLVIPVDLMPGVGRASLFFHEPEVLLTDPPRSPLWLEAATAISRVEGGPAVIEAVETRWRERQGADLIALLGSEYGESRLALEARIQAKVAAHVPPDGLLDRWSEPVLRRAAEQAQIATEVYSRLALDQEEGVWVAAGAWATVLELLAQRLVEESLSHLEQQWQDCPTSRDETYALLDELPLDIGSSRRHLGGVFADGLPAAIDSIRRFLPNVAGGTHRSHPVTVGAGTAVLIWCMAAVVSPSGREQHAGRIGRAMEHLPSLFEDFRFLIDGRNLAFHRRGHPAPAEVLARRTLSVWRALGETAAPTSELNR